jgi:hypothetical protein
MKPFLSIHIIIHVFCVSDTLGSAPGRNTNLKPVSLELSGTEPAIFKKKKKKFPVAELSNKDVLILMHFYGNIFYIHNLYISFPFLLNGPISSITYDIQGPSL